MRIHSHTTFEPESHLDRSILSAVLRLISAGAAQGLAAALVPRFEVDAHCEVHASFMPVGAVEEKMLAGEPADVVVSSEAMLDRLAREGRVERGTLGRLGRVSTGIAVRAGEPVPAIDTEPRLCSALSSARRIFIPDPERATAGIHFVKVLRTLGLHEKLAPRLAASANGAAAMAALAADASGGGLGCTQVTEILNTAGVTLVGALPAPLELSTAYAAAVSAMAGELALARRFAALLAAPETERLRSAAGFEP